MITAANYTRIETAFEAVLTVPTVELWLIVRSTVATATFVPQILKIRWVVIMTKLLSMADFNWLHKLIIWEWIGRICGWQNCVTPGGVVSLISSSQNQISFPSASLSSSLPQFRTFVQRGKKRVAWLWASLNLHFPIITQLYSKNLREISAVDFRLDSPNSFRYFHSTLPSITQPGCKWVNTVTSRV